MKIRLLDRNWPNTNVEYRKLLNLTLTNYSPSLSDVSVKSLSGGLSGAVVFAVFPDDPSQEFIIVKTDETDKIKNEIVNYHKIPVKNGNPHIAKLEYPDDPDDCTKNKVIGVDGKLYSALVYTYIGRNVHSRDSFKPLDQWIDLILESGNGVDQFKDFLDQLFYILSDTFYVKKTNSLHFWFSQEIKIPWDDYIRVIQAYEAFNPGWREFAMGLQDKWQALSKNDNSRIALHKSVCHCDLRCANIIIQVKNGRPVPYIIDFGLVGENSPLADFARLEADILLRLVLDQDDSMNLLVQLADRALLPGGNTENLHPLLRMIFLIREKARSLGNEEWEKLYYAFLVGHTTRMLRWNDSELRGQYKKVQYAWYTLMLFGKVFELILEDPLLSLPKPIVNPDMLEDIMKWGTIDYFFGPERRNKLKRELLDKDEGEVCLLAHTGYSYLHFKETSDSRGNKFDRFYSHMKRRLERGGIVKIILLNPYSVEGSKLGIAEARGYLKGPELDLDYHEHETELFSRFDLCMKGYEKLRENHSNIQLHITHYSPDVTILMSDERAFIEPYLVGQVAWRYHEDMKMNAPELLCDANTKLYEVAKAQFSFFWNRSIPVDEYENSRNEYKDDFIRSERLRRKMVALHESWFALDPIVGCPNYCSYCFLTPYRINHKTPFIFHESSKAFEKLEKNEWLKRQRKYLEVIDWKDPRLPLPVAIGNYTEMLDNNSTYIMNSTEKVTTNEQELKNLLKHYPKTFRSWEKIPILCLITKQEISDEMIDYLKDYLTDNPKIRIAFFTSISFLPPGIESVVKNHLLLLDNFRKINELNKALVNKEDPRNRRIAGIHFWRPLLPGLNDNIEKNINLVSGSGAVSSVAVGLKISKRLAESIKKNKGFKKNMEGIESFNLPQEYENGGDYFDEGIIEKIINVSSDHPVFFNTSCALSHAFGQPDYNGSYEHSQLPADDQVIASVSHLSKVRQYKIIRNPDIFPHVQLEGTVDQEAQTFIRQILGVEVMASVRTTHEWKGAISRFTEGQQCRDSKCPSNQRELCEKYYSERDEEIYKGYNGFNLL